MCSVLAVLADEPKRSTRSLGAMRTCSPQRNFYFHGSKPLQMAHIEFCTGECRGGKPLHRRMQRSETYAAEQAVAMRIFEAMVALRSSELPRLRSKVARVHGVSQGHVVKHRRQLIRILIG
jgi:hypothetical protein